MITNDNTNNINNDNNNDTNNGNNDDTNDNDNDNNNNNDYNNTNHDNNRWARRAARGKRASFRGSHLSNATCLTLLV